jgi:hypothetical protein
MNVIQAAQLGATGLCILSAVFNIREFKRWRVLRLAMGNRLRPIGKVIQVNGQHIQLGVWDGIPPVGTVLFTMDPPTDEPKPLEA